MHRLISYLKVGRLLHLFCIFEIALLFAMYNLFNVGAWLYHGSDIFKMIFLLPFISAFFSQLDAWSRYQNYKMLRDKFYYYGFQPRLIRPFIKSRCQRDAVFTAAQELGFGKLCHHHFYAQGYRWYNIFPDIILSHPQELFKKQFWQTTLFVKKYTSKVDTPAIRKYKETKQQYQLAP